MFSMRYSLYLFLYNIVVEIENEFEHHIQVRRYIL